MTSEPKAELFAFERRNSFHNFFLWNPKVVTFARLGLIGHFFRGTEPFFPESERTGPPVGGRPHSIVPGTPGARTRRARAVRVMTWCRRKPPELRETMPYSAELGSHHCTVSRRSSRAAVGRREHCHSQQAIRRRHNARREAGRSGSIVRESGGGFSADLCAPDTRSLLFQHAPSPKRVAPAFPPCVCSRRWRRALPLQQLLAARLPFGSTIQGGAQAPVRLALENYRHAEK